jgi:hypothetical protein
MSRWRSARRGGRRVVAALALLIALGVVAAIILGAGSSPASHAADASSSPSATTTIQRRQLVQTDTEPGTLGHADPQTVYNRLSGTITWLPSVGQVIRPGQALFRIAGEPVILMDGHTPAYRELGPSDSDGQDVLELNRDLVALGFNPEGIVVADAWQAATTAGVDALQVSLSEPETGTLALGQLVFLPGDRLVASVSAQLGSQAALRTAAPAPEFVSLTSTGTTTEDVTPTETVTSSASATTPSRARAPHHHAPSTQTLAALLALLKAETAQLKAAEAQLRAARSNPIETGRNVPKAGNTPSASVPPTDGSGNLGAATGGGSATPVLATSSTQLVVTVQLDPSKQSEAKVGRPVTVEMPSGNTVPGRISAVSPIAQSSNDTSGTDGGGGAGTANGSGPSTTVPVTIDLRGRPSDKGLDQASVNVSFVPARARNVLSVPVTALLATQGGRYALQEQAIPRRLIPVTPGLFAAGYVEISGTGIYPGLVVADSQG